MQRLVRFAVLASVLAGTSFATAQAASASVRPNIYTTLEGSGLAYPECVTDGNIFVDVKGAYSYTCLRDNSPIESYSLYVTWY